MLKVKPEQIDSVDRFYDQIVNETPNITQTFRWRRDTYPLREEIEAYIAEGTLFMVCNENEIISVFALTTGQDADYDKISWEINAAPDEIAVIHMFAVSPDHQGKGMGKKILKEIAAESKAEGKKVLRLNAVETNLPARRLYQSFGFRYRGALELYAANTGWAPFCFYEYALSNMDSGKH